MAVRFSLSFEGWWWVVDISLPSKRRYNMSGISAFHDTITVNFNYRTGPIGWMAFQEDVAANRSTGNWGILDIQSALRWVRREIGAFGGDPETVAIHGQSSGGGLIGEPSYQTCALHCCSGAW